MFQKFGDVEVKEVRKTCPQCGMQIIAADVFVCDNCKVKVASINTDKLDSTPKEERKDVFQNR